MEIIGSILSVIIGFFTFILILRSWLEFCRVDPRMPLSQSLLRMSEPVLAPIKKVIPTRKGINFAAILLAVVLLMAEKWIVFGLSVPLAVLAGVLGVLKTLIRALMSWVTQGNHPLDYMVAQITEPVLGIIRRILPRTGMLDFSVMVLGFALILLNNVFYNIFGVLWAIA
ncbi:MAG: YggT family protein [Haemophilus parahaemolyticus]|nr:YggT family protein [Haemophilus parahaemolyticus]